MTRTLLIDADIIAFQSTAVTQRDYDWGDTGTSRSADLEEAQECAEDIIFGLIQTLKADEVIICLSDDVVNFREGIYPPYKQNRTGERPELLYDIKAWLADEYESVIMPTLEADDVMGILATQPHEGERIIVSDDKDMKTVPAPFYRPCRNKAEKKKDNEGIVRTTPEEAERFMLWQALTGDTTDGYPGCPGIGPKAADRILDELTVRRSYDHVLKQGPRKGEVEVRKKDVIYEDRWSAIVAAYEEAGLTEKDAIVQVNLARILKASDVEDGRVIPWKPE